jgi:hypothetical protein
VTFPSYLLLPNAESEKIGGGGGSDDLLRDCNADGHSSVPEESWDWLQAMSDAWKVRDFSFQHHATHEYKVNFLIAVLSHKEFLYSLVRDPAGFAGSLHMLVGC